MTDYRPRTEDTAGIVIGDPEPPARLAPVAALMREGDPDSLAKAREALAGIAASDLLAKLQGIGEDGEDLIAKAVEDDDPAALRKVLDAMRPPRDLADFARSDFGGQPSAREWLAGSGRDGWLPAGRVAMLTGEGEAGKSRLALQLACAVAGEAGAEARRAIPSDRPATKAAEDAGPVVSGKLAPAGAAYVGWEDEAAEAWRRVAWLRDGGLATAGALGGRLHYLDAAAAHVGPLWGPVSEGSRHISTAAAWTRDGRDVLAWCESVPDVRLAILDPLAAAFGSNENDRALVRGFFAGLGAWAEARGIAVLIVGHPAKGDGRQQGVYSGCTDWRNAPRALWTLRPEKVPGFKPPGKGAEGIVMPGFFAARGLSFVAGRGFGTGGPGEEKAREVVINRAYARAHFLEPPAVGRWVALGGYTGERHVVVGVVGGGGGRGLGASGSPYAAYFSALEHPPAEIEVVASVPPHAAADEDDSVDIAREVLAGLSGGRLSVTALRPAREEVERVYGTAAWLGGGARGAGALGALAAVFGLVGAMRAHVRSRLRDMGIRAAIGAAPRTLLRLVAGEALRMGAVGVGAGLWGAALVVGVLAPPGVDNFDAPVFGAVGAVFLGAVAAAAAPGAGLAAKAEPRSIMDA